MRNTVQWHEKGAFLLCYATLFTIFVACHVGEKVSHLLQCFEYFILLEVYLGKIYTNTLVRISFVTLFNFLNLLNRMQLGSLSTTE